MTKPYLLLAFNGRAALPSDRQDGVESITHYALSPEQPGPVMLGLRPGSPYAALTIVALTDPAAMDAIVARTDTATPFAYWLYRPISDLIERDVMPDAAPHIHLAFTNPADGREDDYNAWYSGDHLAHALIVDGFATAQRFKLDRVAGDGADPSPYAYLTLYGLRTNDIRASEDDMHKYASGEKPGMPLSDALGPVRATWVYSPA